MIETRVYTCEYCGAEFDDEYDAHKHEWNCAYNDVTKQDGSNLKFFDESGKPINFNENFFVDDVAAFTVGNERDIQFVVDFLEWHGFENPFRRMEIEDYEYMNIDDVWKLVGLWWFDLDLHYGEWVRVDDQIKRWTDIKNKFEKGA